MDPSSRFSNQGFKILRYDDNFMLGVNKEEYLKDSANYGTVVWKEKKDPMNAWATPFIIGKKYKIHFGKTGLDWMKMKIDISDRYLERDDGVYFVHNFTDVRALMDIQYNGGEKTKNDTIAQASGDWRNG